MFSIGEHIIHPGQGVCTVTGFEDSLAPMIVLEAKSGHARTTLKYPVAQVDRLHPCIGREDAERLSSTYAELECDPFTERNSSLEESYFKRQLKLGAPETVRVARPCAGASTTPRRAPRSPAAITPGCSRRHAAAPSRSSPSPWTSPRRQRSAHQRRRARCGRASVDQLARSQTAAPAPSQKGDRHQIERRRHGGARAIVWCSKPPSPDGGIKVSGPLTVVRRSRSALRAGVPGTCISGADTSGGTMAQLETPA